MSSTVGLHLLRSACHVSTARSSMLLLSHNFEERTHFCMVGALEGMVFLAFLTGFLGGMAVELKDISVHSLDIYS